MINLIYVLFIFVHEKLTTKFKKRINFPFKVQEKISKLQRYVGVFFDLVCSKLWNMQQNRILIMYNAVLDVLNVKFLVSYHIYVKAVASYEFWISKILIFKLLCNLNFSELKTIKFKLIYKIKFLYIFGLENEKELKYI